MVDRSAFFYAITFMFGGCMHYELWMELFVIVQLAKVGTDVEKCVLKNKWELIVRQLNKETDYSVCKWL